MTKEEHTPIVNNVAHTGDKPHKPHGLAQAPGAEGMVSQTRPIVNHQSNNDKGGNNTAVSKQQHSTGSNDDRKTVRKNARAERYSHLVVFTAPKAGMNSKKSKVDPAEVNRVSLVITLICVGSNCLHPPPPLPLPPLLLPPSRAPPAILYALVASVVLNIVHALF